MRRTVGQINREVYKSLTDVFTSEERREANDYLVFYLALCVPRKVWDRAVAGAALSMEAARNAKSITFVKKAASAAAVAVLAVLVLPLGARAQGFNSIFKIQDSRWAAAASPVPDPAGPMPILRQAPAAEPLGATARRAYKFTAMAARHLAGAFDAYSTNQIFNVPPPVKRFTGSGAVSTYTFTAREWNPLLRPFAGTPAIYPAIQVRDGVFSAWLLRAKSPRSRKAAWIAVGVQIGLHVGLGLNNIRQANDQWALYRAMTSGPFVGVPGRNLR